jgi:hypothetical protein
MFGIPRKVKSDNGPPFDSHHFANFAKQLGFKHHRVTPYWPRANGMCERFMRNIGKVIRSANMDNSDWESELIELLRNYRATPHSTTKVPPKDLLLKSSTCTSSIGNMSRQSPIKDKLNKKAEHNDKLGKQRMTMHSNKNQKVKPTKIIAGDWVLQKNINPRKTQPLFDPKPLKVMETNGSQCKIVRDNVVYIRNQSMLKKIKRNPGKKRINNNTNDTNNANNTVDQRPEHHQPEQRRPKQY